MHTGRTPVLPLAIGTALASWWAACSLLLHGAFHSNAWDLGVFTQVTWNTAHGEPFEYSFRAISYAGDHWQPALLLFVPLTWAGGGAATLLVSQAVLLGAAIIPLYLCARHGAGQAAALLACFAYAFSPGVARAVSFDVHLEALAPLLCFTAVYGLVLKRDWLFIVPALLLLTIKEDAPILVLGLVVLAAWHFQWRRKAAAVAAVAILYGAVVNLWLIPHYRGDELNPLAERYGYLGDSATEILLAIPTHPAEVVRHVVTWDKGAVVLLLVLLAAAAAPLFRPIMILAGAPLVVLPALSQDNDQARFELHYLLVPTAFAFSCLLFHLNRPPASWWPGFSRHLTPRRTLAASAAASFAVFMLHAPLPPSLAFEPGRFAVDHHARVSRSFVGMVPPGAIVSAQSPFVPHLAQRREIFVFPRVLTSEYVLIDDYGPKPQEDLEAGYDACRAALPRLGFDLVREEDGIQLWRKVRPAESIPHVPPACSGQKPAS
jgi:uncharacterized membrane protein